MDIAVLVVLFAAFIPVLLFVSFVLKKIIWEFHPLFYFANNVIWILYNPLRFVSKNTSSTFPSFIFRVLLFTLVIPVYWIVVHIATLSFRMIISLYYDVILYWTVMLDDILQELFYPKMGRIRHLSGFKYYLAWLIGFPFRLIKFLVKAPLTILDSIFMFATSAVLPTFTMYHGSDFSSAVSDITQKGKWLVGSGNFAGSGIYFGNKKAALHYSRSKGDQGLIVARVTLTPTINAAALSQNLRNLVGQMGYAGEQLSNRLPFPWATIEHWRRDLGWWEYCIVQKNKAGRYISSWRIKPVAILDGEGKPRRLWNGQSHYSLTVGGATAGVISLAILFYALSVLEA